MTIKDIAKQAGVSTATVSYVINGTKPVTHERRQRVLDVISKTNYQPSRIAKSLRTKKTQIIGVLVEDILAFPSPLIIDGIAEFLERSEFQMLLSDLRMMGSLYNKYDQIIHQKEKINQALSFMVYGARVDSIIYLGMFDREISGIIPDLNRPTIIAYSTSSDPHVCTVTYENELISAELCRHLIVHGHKRIAVITGLPDTSPVKLRMKGISAAFEENGMTLESFLIKHGDWERESGYSAMRELLSQSGGTLPTAVLAMNDYMAIGAIDAIREAGLRVPEDISVVGFDNREVSDYVFPKITTAEIDLRAIGYAAARQAVGQHSGDDQFAKNSSIIIPSKLILRDTVKHIST